MENSKNLWFGKLANFSSCYNRLIWKMINLKYEIVQFEILTNFQIFTMRKIKKNSTIWKINIWQFEKILNNFGGSNNFSKMEK